MTTRWKDRARRQAGGQLDPERREKELNGSKPAAGHPLSLTAQRPRAPISNQRVPSSESLISLRLAVGT